ncbi:MAG TPA: hypothetical protein VGE07_24400 [Herpetosiphonaceae bacterium]
MHRRWITSALMGLALLAALAGPARPAAACSIAPPSIEWTAPYAEVIALGEVTAADENRLDLKVDEYWKGGSGEPTLSIDNRRHQLTGADCSTAELPGPLVTPGTRIIAFLQSGRNSETDWVFLGTLDGSGYIIVDGQIGSPPALPSDWAYPPETAAAWLKDDILAYANGVPEPQFFPDPPPAPVDNTARRAVGLAMLGGLAVLGALALGFWLGRRSARGEVDFDDPATGRDE